MGTQNLNAKPVVARVGSQVVREYNIGVNIGVFWVSAEGPTIIFCQFLGLGRHNCRFSTVQCDNPDQKVPESQKVPTPDPGRLLRAFSERPISPAAELVVLRDFLEV